MKINVIEPKKKEAERLRVCAYCRVSTDHEDQENSLENQVSHYEHYIQNNPMYEYAGVYYDIGISGFKEKRPGYQQMMEDARAGKIDLIIVKSITRLARNTVTILKTIRELRDMRIGIFFELQNINTLTESGELMITILSAFAQGESEQASLGAKMVYRRKYEAGIPVQYLDRCFGYMKDENGFFVPDPSEAIWVKKMYKLAAKGYTQAQIARFLNEKGIKTTAGADFTESTVIRILESEIYKGDYIIHKHFVNADRKIVKNEGQEDAWYVEDDHIPIVKRRLWQKAQDELAKRREYLGQASLVGDLDSDTYPYKDKIFCAGCGHPLYRRIYSNRNRVCWTCSGKKRFNKSFCAGVDVPDSVIRDWGDLPGSVYIRAEKDELGKKTFKYVKESTWMRFNKKKERI